MGFALQPLKAQGLAAARGTTPFSLLFLGFSMFIIAAAMMLVALLFRLGMENRAREVGVLLAVGYPARSVRRMWLLEGLLIAGAGAAVGVLLGLGYATLMIAAIRHPEWWMSAVSTPFLEMHPMIASGLIGYLAGVLVSLGAIAASLRMIRRASVRRLLAGGTQEELQTQYRTPRISRWIAIAAVVISIALGAGATRLDGEAQAGAFFGAGSLVLTAALLLIWSSLRQGGTGALVTSGGGAISRLALRNGARHPGRGTLTMGLVAAASFLIIAISAFRLDPPDARRKDSGAGGFSLVAQSDQPLFANLNTAAGRSELNFTAADSKLLQSATTYSLRVRPGDDASCLNLYQPQQPTVLGATPELVERGGFAWAGTAASSDEERANPWLLLEKPLPGDDAESAVIPVVIDQATAMFSLHLSGVGARYSVLDDQGNTVELEVVGLLKNSLLQGVLVIHERDFLEHFPTISGYQYFFVETPVDQAEQVEQVLEKNLSDQGFDAQRTEARLAAFMAVQNTYLSTFQSLGGLGLLLGTFGLAVVQLRNVLERRGELALLRATGFRRSLLARMVMLENAILLVGGLAVGVVAALVAVFPHLISGGAAIPWLSLAITLGTVLIVGLMAGLIAVRAALVAPLLPALRGD